MAAIRIASPLAGLIVVAAALSGCTGMQMPSFPGFGGTPEQPPPPAAADASVPSRYTPEELVGRWGFTS